MSLKLLRFEAAILSAAIGKITLRPLDLLIGVIGVPVLVMVARSQLNEIQLNHGAILSFCFSAYFIAFISIWIVERIEFHQSEGVMAGFAQEGFEVIVYGISILLAGGAIILLILSILGALYYFGALAGLAIGVPIGLAVAHGRRLARIKSPPSLSIEMFDIARQKNATIISLAVSATIGAGCIIFSDHENAATLIAGGYGLAVAFVAGRVDPSTVRYLTMVGYSADSMLRLWVPMQFALIAPFAGVLAISHNWAGAGAAALFAFVLLSLTALRVLAYRALSRLMADWFVAAVVAVSGYMAMFLPPIGPVVFIVAIVLIARRGAAMKWLLT